MLLRASVAAAVLIGGIFATHSFKLKEAAGLQRPLGEFPSAIGFSRSEDRPFDQPVVFRSPSGRYLVHRIEKPVTSARIPERLDQAEPNKE